MKTVQINTYELELLQKGYSEQVELNHNFNFKIQELEEENKELKTYIKNYQISLHDFIEEQDFIFKKIPTYK